MTIVAITGATGFVGKTVIRLALDKGFSVRALTRRAQDARPGVTWVAGALDDPESLGTLVRGSDVVIHIAGVVNSPNRAGFAAANIEGTRAIADAALGEGVSRLIHVSSLAAREPEMSNYGWSKAGAEDAIRESGLDWTMVRPPAIYGPEDTEMLELFRMARRGLVLLPPGNGRLSVIEVSDLARLLIALIDDHASIGQVYEADDGTVSGWTHRGFAQAIGAAMSKRVATFASPKPLLRIASRMDRMVRRGGAKLTADRVDYFCHPDWVIDPAQRPRPALWEPQVNTRAGLKATVSWYRRKGWLG